MLKLSTQLSSDETLDGQANNHSKKNLKKSGELSSTSVHCVPFAATLSFTWLTCETIALKILFHKLKAKRMSCLIS